MAAVPPPLPPTHEQYLEGLKQGRDLYREDLDAIQGRTAQTYLLLVIVVGVALLGLLFIGGVMLLQQVAQ